MSHCMEIYLAGCYETVQNHVVELLMMPANGRWDLIRRLKG